MRCVLIPFLSYYNCYPSSEKTGHIKTETLVVKYRTQVIYYTNERTGRRKTIREVQIMDLLWGKEVKNFNHKRSVIEQIQHLHQGSQTQFTLKHLKAESG